MTGQIQIKYKQGHFPAWNKTCWRGLSCASCVVWGGSNAIKHHHQWITKACQHDNDQNNTDTQETQDKHNLHLPMGTTRSPVTSQPWSPQSPRRPAEMQHLNFWTSEQPTVEIFNAVSVTAFRFYFNMYFNIGVKGVLAQLIQAELIPPWGQASPPALTAELRGALLSWGDALVVRQGSTTLQFSWGWLLLPLCQGCAEQPRSVGRTCAHWATGKHVGGSNLKSSCVYVFPG